MNVNLRYSFTSIKSYWMLHILFEMKMTFNMSNPRNIKTNEMGASLCLKENEHLHSMNLSTNYIKTILLKSSLKKPNL